MQRHQVYTSLLLVLMLTISATRSQEDQEDAGDDVEDACKGNPCGNGICHLDEGIEEQSGYHCYCEDGYTGQHCETDWDECWSDPCLNGATCIDQVADYNCTCAPGFRGKTCEINVNECMSNPCQNNATCVDDVNGYMCECPHGFKGQNCEIDVSVCNATENKCANGGQCIDGLGAAFFCYCPPGWEGKTCEENVDECEANPCQNGGMCMDLPGTFICSCPFGFVGSKCEIELEQCDTNPCKNDALCFIVDDSYECYCVPDYHGKKCEYKYNDCLLPPLPKCFNGGVCLDGVDTYECSCPEGFFGQNCECPPEAVDDASLCLNVNESVSWELPSRDLLMSLTTTMSPEENETMTPDYLKNRLDDKTPLALEIDEPDIMSSIDPSLPILSPTSTIVYNMSDLPVTSLYIYEISSSDLVTKSFLAGDDYIIRTSPTMSDDMMESTDYEGDLVSPTMSSLEPSQEMIIPVAIVTQSSLDVLLTGPTGTATTTIEITTPSLEELGIEPMDRDMQDDSEEDHATTTEDTLTTTIEGTSTATSMMTEDMHENRVDTIENDMTSNVTEVFDVIMTDSITSDFDERSCTANVCRNGGTCLATLNGPKCHCPLQYSGRQCEEEVMVDVPGFVGHSLLVHSLPQETSGINIMLTFRTSTPNGLLFYTGGKDEMMIASYLQNGILKFKVSCGLQTILFSDPRDRVDTGFQQSVRIKLTLDTPTMCSTLIQLNETHTMKGEQELIETPKQPEQIYFGLMPNKRDPEIDIVQSGFQGCMNYLQINDEDVHLYKDAVSGRDIVECKSAVCAIRPCRNGAVCTQHEENGSWFCNCPPGYTGALCERPVCATNPCRYGGTCLGSNTGPGFLCLCPVGRGGALCQEELDITQPSFTSSVGGYSSYLAFPVEPQDVVKEIEVQFHFTAEVTDQVALLFFLGQEGFHEYGSDYMAVSYVKGHILLTWDLGAGPRRIFTKRPVDERYLVHSVQFGRYGRLGFLQVDNFQNITGRAPGLRENLNITSKVMFVGGHENHNFTLLPHDLPVHRGFQGCIFDLALRSNLGQLLPLPKPSWDSSPVKGRNVHQCHMDVCFSNPCSNGGTCIGFGASFVCECPDGRFGVTCEEESSACTTGRHQCAEGSKCSVMKDGNYECYCPLGKTGKFCDEELIISDPLFRGENSFMSLSLDTAIRFNTEVALEIRPDSLEGLLVHFGQSRDARHQDYFTLMLKNGTLELSFSLGGPRGGQSHALTLTLCCVRAGNWHKIRAGRSGRDGYLMLDEQQAVGNAPPGLTTLDVDHTLNLGGLETFGSYYLDPETDDPNYQGCMRNLMLNGVAYPLTPEAGWRGMSIEDCDGTACGGEVCQHEGVCELDDKHPEGYTCDCKEDFRGRNCEIHSLCEDAGGCQNGATCSVKRAEVSCDCAYGFTGDFCEDAEAITVPSFDGNGYLSFNMPETKSIRHITSFSLELKTTSNDGMLLWIGEDLTSDDYLGVGIRKGMVHLVWNLGWFSRTELTIPSPTVKINDGNWHNLKIHRVRQSVDVEIDGEVYNSRVTGSYYELNTANSILIGGSNGRGKILDITRGHFETGFSGCIRNVIVQNIEVFAHVEDIEGKNVRSCKGEEN